jgi:NAD(P)-dependent dehydrogenase (short-subunit alcohol dehydrogenase family)
MQLHGRTAIVTGASRGLGRAIARAFAARGANLVLSARGVEDLEHTAEELSARTEVLALALDVSQEAERLVEAAERRFGGVDVLVNNASELGPTPLLRLEDLEWRAFEHILRVNVLAPHHLAQLVLPGMRERGEGVVINVSSDAAVEAYQTWGGYGASKAALDHLTRTLAAELEGSGVRVYSVDPGNMNTAMYRAAEPDDDHDALPDPEGSAPAFVRLVEETTEPYARVEAQDLASAQAAAVIGAAS